MLSDHVPTTTTIIACDPNAVPLDIQDQWGETGKYVYAAVQAVQELPDGYAFLLPTNSAVLLKIAEFITYERLCCPFLHFTVEIAPMSGPFWLRLTGGAGVKDYLRSEFAMNALLNDDVAKAAGLRSSSDVA